MQNLISLWKSLSMMRRMAVVGATVAMFAAVLALSRIASAPNMALLYSGLDSRAAGEVVAALEQSGAAYEVQGDSIRVDAAMRDQLRMMLATEGLPASSGTGYELLDGLSGFGTTSQMFDAAYLRAKEGELARTILANPGIRSARVHIAQDGTQPFRRDSRPTASVTVGTADGTLPPAQAKALKHLVAAAVSGMKAEDVSVIDSVGGLIDAAEAPVATDRADHLRANVERLLAARVGPGRAVVEVSVDVETASEQISERRFDPQGRVAISSEATTKTSNDTRPAGDVTVASNLPEGDAAAGPSGQSQASESREMVNYEVSETQREVLRAPGDIRKISVAVLVDGVQGPDGWAERTPEELAVLHDLVASAVGLDTARGDVLTLRSLQFQTPAELGTLAEGGLLASLGGFDLMTAIQLAVLAFVVLVLGLFVLRPILTTKREPVPIPMEPPLALPGATRVLDGEIADDDHEPEPENPVDRLRRLIDARQVESVEILRDWMNRGRA
ncbi:flagellar basal-body MS-ring/collar protein FliF [Cereibacter sp. SYSU M97828]|nr:flagellar basal-body MS-ring/collar protein FliF [Cereibacter flavus]